jgi:hypothetical protein
VLLTHPNRFPRAQILYKTVMVKENQTAAKLFD